MHSSGGTREQAMHTTQRDVEAAVHATAGPRTRTGPVIRRMVTSPQKSHPSTNFQAGAAVHQHTAGADVEIWLHSAMSKSTVQSMF